MTNEEMDQFLESIGGLENGFFSDRPKIKSNGFLLIENGWFGLVKELIEDCIALGWDKQICQIKEKFDADSVVSIFILPPSLQELERRLRGRAQDPENIVQGRMKKAQDEISHFGEYDFVLINDDLNSTYQKIRSIIESKRSARVSKPDLQKFVSQNLS